MKTRMFCLVLLLSAGAPAQSSSGYVFFAPGAVSSGGRSEATLHVGGGVDGLLGKGVGLGIELGALGPARHMSDSIGAFSPGLNYHFGRDTERGVDPFIAGGYTLLFRQGVANLGYFGAGMNYWFGGKLGLRLEFRDHVYPTSRLVHYWGVRVALAIR